jgi:hypothetical protein
VHCCTAAALLHCCCTAAALLLLHCFLYCCCNMAISMHPTLPTHLPRGTYVLIITTRVLVLAFRVFLPAGHDGELLGVWYRLHAEVLHTV